MEISSLIKNQLAKFSLRERFAKCKLIRCSGKLPEELKELRKTLGISYADMLIFFNELGFLPSPGYSISIRHWGVEEVIKCIQDNLHNKTLKI